jgi:plastocyanin
MSIFKIQIKPGNPATFDPKTQTAQVNDSIYWANGDQTQAHWPAPSASNPKGYMDYQIAPGGVSTQIALNPPAPYTLNYVCALHPGETGSIQVVGKSKKGPFGPNTKKGSFGPNTKKGAFAAKTK